MPNKQLNMTIVRCLGCPFMVYDHGVFSSTKPAYMCHHPEFPHTKFLAVDRDIADYNQKVIAYNESLEAEKPRHPLSIPDWCPLPDTEEA